MMWVALRLLLLVSLSVPPAAAGPLGHPGAAVPLYGLSSPCLDPRYPALAGPWAVGCGPDGLVDRVTSLRTGHHYPLPLRARSPALTDGALYIPGRGGGLVRFTPSGVTEVSGIATIHQPATAPAALMGDRVVVLSADAVQSARVTAQARHLYEASPVGWYPPALTDSHVAWVDTGGTPSATEIWWMPLEGGTPERLAADGRHVVGDGSRLAWVTDTSLEVLEVSTGVRSTYPVETGFLSAPSMWAQVLCWEHWGPTDLDITCDDGLSATGPGHQQRPSRWGPWLLYREGDQVWLRTAAEAP